MNKIVSLLLIILALLSVLVYIMVDSNNSGEIREDFFIVMPHHIITAKAFDKNYKKLSEKYVNVKNIVIISPNHFSSGTQFIETFKEPGTYCYGKDVNKIDISRCIKGEGVDFYKYEKDELFDLANYEEYAENFFAGKKYLVKEHGIGEHFYYINKYFSDYEKVIPLVIDIERNGNFKQTEGLYEKIKDYNFGDGNTLYIASVDFSHHVFEKMGIFHDMAAVEELNKDQFEKAEVDCPNCLFAIKKLATDSGKGIFKLNQRTSSSGLMDMRLNYDNTTHIFGEFISGDSVSKKEVIQKNLKYFDKNSGYKKSITQINIKKTSNNLNNNVTGVYGVFFGDSHLTRGFDDKKSYSDKKKYFECFYQNKNSKNNIRYWKNTILHGLDYVGINFETAMCEIKDTVRSEKSIKFLTKPEYLKYFTDVGFNMFNLSNNHTYDYGKFCYEQGKKYLKTKGLAYFGEGRKDESEVFLSEKNGVKLAFMGINDTTFSWSEPTKIKKITELSNKGYQIILNIHWGIEYQKTNNKRQQQLAHRFIDAGVDMIIGHHPHVVQNVEVYKGVPIFYSLGNFIFDQRFDNTLKGYGVVYRIDNESLKYDLIEFTRKEEDFSIDCESWK